MTQNKPRPDGRDPELVALYAERDRLKGMCLRAQTKQRAAEERSKQYKQDYKSMLKNLREYAKDAERWRMLILEYPQTPLNEAVERLLQTHKRRQRAIRDAAP